MDAANRASVAAAGVRGAFANGRGRGRPLRWPPEVRRSRGLSSGANRPRSLLSRIAIRTAAEAPDGPAFKPRLLASGGGVASHHKMRVSARAGASVLTPQLESRAREPDLVQYRRSETLPADQLVPRGESGGFARSIPERSHSSPPARTLGRRRAARIPPTLFLCHLADHQRTALDLLTNQFELRLALLLGSLPSALHLVTSPGRTSRRALLAGRTRASGFRAPAIDAGAPPPWQRRRASSSFLGRRGRCSEGDSLRRLGEPHRAATRPPLTTVAPRHALRCGFVDRALGAIASSIGSDRKARVRPRDAPIRTAGPDPPT